jgi:sigma-B regulation protein RsbU (phosphoserine phosphatase)
VGASGGTNSVLLIESSPISARALEGFLTKNGFLVSALSDGAGLAAKLKVAPPDLVILSTELTTGSGFDVCKRIKEEWKECFVPILMLSGSDAPNEQLRAISSGADDYMQKNSDSSIILSKVRALARIKNLSDQLKAQYTQLADKERLLDAQLKMARQVQRSLIKECDFTFNGARFVGRYLPAMDIGGDFFEIMKLDKDCVAVAIGDVSGHGISASLLTTMLNMMVKNMAHKFVNPAQFLFHMNNEFINIFESGDNQMYACLFYAIVNTAKRRIYYSNAGQSLPLHVKPRKLAAEEMEVYGTPIGMMKDSVYEHKIALIDDGDIVLFYTDGLADNLYKGDDEFLPKMKTLLLEQEPGADAADVINSVLDMCYKEEVIGNRKYEMDDVSVIVCQAEFEREGAG